MNANIGTNPIAAASPQRNARIAGAFYLLTFLAGGLALWSAGSFVVSGDPALTAANIQANESAFRLGVLAADLIASICYVVVTALFYDLFRPVSRRVSLLAAFMSLVGCAVGALSGAFHLAPVAILGGAKYLSVFNPEQLQALALLSLKLHGLAQSIALIFFGFYCVLIGWLILRSTFLPRILGVLMMLGGLGWLTFLWQPLADALSPYVLAPGIIGEGALTLWLLVRGVNGERWCEQAHVAGRVFGSPYRADDHPAESQGVVS